MYLLINYSIITFIHALLRMQFCKVWFFSHHHSCNCGATPLSNWSHPTVKLMYVKAEQSVMELPLQEKQAAVLSEIFWPLHHAAANFGAL